MAINMKLNPTKCKEMLINFLRNPNFLVKPIQIGSILPICIGLTRKFGLRRKLISISLHLVGFNFILYSMAKLCMSPATLFSTLMEFLGIYYTRYITLAIKYITLAIKGTVQTSL